jgi:uncharacterized protein YbaP (TraB family)
MNLRFWSDEKPLRMVWRVEKQGRASHLVGTAHFFPYSFRRPLTRLIRNATTVMFEGPLDEASLARIAEYGRQGGSAPTWIEAVTPESIHAIERLLRDRLDKQKGGAWLLSLVQHKPVYLEAFTRGVRPWAAFFSIWQTCLGWNHSVDLEGYRIAYRLGRPIRFLETIDEQLSVLDNIPLDHFVQHLNNVNHWDAYRNEYVKSFLDGDLAAMMALTAPFATRTAVVVGARDQVLFDRMQPILEREDALAFIGFPHVPGVTRLLLDDGYSVKQVSA